MERKYNHMKRSALFKLEDIMSIFKKYVSEKEKNRLRKIWKKINENCQGGIK